jgi:hypothetical protein
LKKKLLIALLLLATISSYAQSTLSSNQVEEKYWNGTTWKTFKTTEVYITFTVKGRVIRTNDDNNSVYNLIGMLEDSKEKAVYDAVDEHQKECIVTFSNSAGICTYISIIYGKFCFSYRIYRTHL